MALKDMSIDELDQETIKIKEEQPAKAKDKLRAVKKVRDEKVHVDRTRDRLKKILINAMGRAPEECDEYLKDKSLAEMEKLIEPFEVIESKMGVVATPGAATVKVEGK